MHASLIAFGCFVGGGLVGIVFGLGLGAAQMFAIEKLSDDIGERVPHFLVAGALAIGLFVVVAVTAGRFPPLTAAFLRGLATGGIPAFLLVWSWLTIWETVGLDYKG